jgi:hypothetical protein
MHPAYFTVRFLVTGTTPWPDQFAIVTGYATTGEQWTPEQNLAADTRLVAWISTHAMWHHRVTGYSPETGHAEPGFAIALDRDFDVEAACALGLTFAQDALYVVHGDALFVTYCDERRGLVPVGHFRERIDRHD